MTTKRQATKVQYRWDDQDRANEGWYCETYDDDGLIDDSMKIWFPIDLDEYDEIDEKELVTALKEEFPGAEVSAWK